VHNIFKKYYTFSKQKKKEKYTKISKISRNQYWSNLFSINYPNNINNGLYLLGTDSSSYNANVKISLSKNSGIT
jgi:hypothetical protein